MKLLFRLANNLTAKEKHYLENISFRYNIDKENSLFQKFLEFLRGKETCPSDDDCSYKLYGEPASSRYLTLKSRLKARVKEAVAISALEQERRIGKDLNSETQLIYRLLIGLAISRKFNDNNGLITQLKQILKTAEDRNYYCLQILCLSKMQQLGDGYDTTEKIGLSIQRMLHEHATSGYMKKLLTEHFRENFGNVDKIQEMLSRGEEFFPNGTRFGDPLLSCHQLIFDGILAIRNRDYESALLFFQSMEAFTIKNERSVHPYALPLARLMMAETYYRLNQKENAKQCIPEISPILPSYINRRCYHLRLILFGKEPTTETFDFCNEEDMVFMTSVAAGKIMDKNYKEAFGLLNRQYKNDPEMAQWFVHIRILRIMAMIGMKNYPGALREMDSLRKQLYKIDADLSREKKLIYALRHAASHDPNENKVLHTIRQLSAQAGPLARSILSPEIIPVHEWVHEYVNNNHGLNLSVNN